MILIICYEEIIDLNHDLYRFCLQNCVELLGSLVTHVLMLNLVYYRAALES